MTVGTQLKRTPLHAEHAALSAKLVPFAQYEMPVSYPAGILREHDAVRNAAGLFDLSHMAQYLVRGPVAAEFLDYLTVNSVAGLAPGRARYNLFCNEHGGTRDDVIVYRLEHEFLVVANGANADKIWALLDTAPRRDDVELVDLRGVRALIALQGPRAAALLAPHVPDGAADLPYYGCRTTAVFDRPALLARTGYTGEDGFELYVDAADAAYVWRGLLAGGAGDGLLPAGLGARDMLRAEAGLPLYGNELSETLSPLQARLGWTIRYDKGPFVGREALLAEKIEGRRPIITGLVLDGRVPARSGYAVFSGGRRIGVVTTGTVAPSLGGVPIALAFIEPEISVPGQLCAIEIRGSMHPARVVKLPFYVRK